MIQVKRHAEEIQHEPWFKERPWLVAGTGPSLNNHNPSELHTKYNILAINSASDILVADLYFCLDEDNWPDRPSNDFRYVVTRENNRHDYPENTLYIAVQNNPMIKGFENYPSQPSSSQAIELLGRCGIKKAFTVGIDGGYGITAKGLNPNYSHYHAVHKTNFNEENDLMNQTAKRLGVELIRL